MNPPTNGWNEWSKHVLAELERLNGCYVSLDNKLDEVRIEIAKLKVKAGAWGALGGLGIALGVWLIRNVGG